MKRKNFLRGAAALGVSGGVVKALGALYRIPLTAMIGCYGIGLYQSTYSFYAFIATLCSAGIASCLSKRVAERRAQGLSAESAEKSYMRFFSAVGAAGAVAVALFPLIFHGARGEKPSVGYFFLAPALPLVCVASVFCGGFQGEGNMYPTAISEVCGQTAKILFGVLFCAIFKANVEKSAAWLCFAVSLAALCETAALYLFKRKSYEKNENHAGRGALFSLYSVNEAGTIGAKEIFSFTLPVTLSAAVLPLTAFAESLLLPDLMAGYEANPLASYGLFAGGAACVAHLPVTFCRGVAAAAIPDLSSGIKKEGFAGGKKKIIYALLLTLAAAVPLCLCLCLFAPLVVKILFSSLSAREKTLLVACIRILSAGALFLSLAQTLSACMTALGVPKIAAACWGVACLSRILFDLIFIGVSKFSVLGAAIAEVGCYFVAFFLISAYNIAVYRSAKRRFAAA